jgi:hypothetical protein
MTYCNTFRLGNAVTLGPFKAKIGEARDLPYSRCCHADSRAVDDPLPYHKGTAGDLG